MFCFPAKTAAECLTLLVLTLDSQYHHHHLLSFSWKANDTSHHRVLSCVVDVLYSDTLLYWAYFTSILNSLLNWYNYLYVLVRHLYQLHSLRSIHQIGFINQSLSSRLYETLSVNTNISIVECAKSVPVRSKH